MLYRAVLELYWAALGLFWAVLELYWIVRAVLAVSELYCAVSGSIGVVPGSIGVVSSSIGAVSVWGGEVLSTACKCRVVVALRWSRMYVFQVRNVVLYSLEGGSLERAGNSGWAVTVWLFGVFIL